MCFESKHLENLNWMMFNRKENTREQEDTQTQKCCVSFCANDEKCIWAKVARAIT